VTSARSSFWTAVLGATGSTSCPRKEGRTDSLSRPTAEVQWHPALESDGPASEVAREGQSVVVEVPEGELSCAPGGIGHLGAIVEHPFVLVLLEEQIWVVHVESQHASTSGAGLEVSLELELQMYLDSSATNACVLGFSRIVLEDRLESESLNVKGDRFTDIPSRKYRDDIRELGPAPSEHELKSASRLLGTRKKDQRAGVHQGSTDGSSAHRARVCYAADRAISIENTSPRPVTSEHQLATAPNDVDRHISKALILGIVMHSVIP
jgi:hypothetical protein